MKHDERLPMASYAAWTATSFGRKYPEERKDARPLYERDKDRVIHSAAFRRLEYKTQVFVNHEGDYFRTRLTHTIEVAQIARAVARRLRLNEDLAEAISLAHDLGHTPFGHAGEDALNEILAHTGGFNHNRQSLRVVDTLEKRYPEFIGLNLSFETREGIIKHSSTYDIADRVYAEYEPRYVPTIEAQLINLADEIAYNNHDIDDGITSGLIDFEEVETLPVVSEIVARLKKKYPTITASVLKYKLISMLIGVYIDDLATTTEANIKNAGIAAYADIRRANVYVAELSAGLNKENGILKLFLNKKLYHHYRVERMRIKAKKIVKELFAAYVEHPSLLAPKYLERLELDGLDTCVADYIAGMTDRYAEEEYKKLFFPSERV